MTNYSPSQTDPDDFPLEPGLVDQVHWINEESEAPTFPEGAWSERTAEVADVLRPGYRYQVKYEATYWTAVPVEEGTTYNLGDRVAVLGRRGNELMISALPQPSES
ncbi:NfeD family protein [Nodosilinea nodulosa]|uniref:NfeD family protein n=1 Tax=Nodosilinea nodulosa TaxID=416001 RepID=UPI00031D82E2|nr:hypothetical protein [Nodosilinea nodulosa]